MRLLSALCAVLLLCHTAGGQKPVAVPARPRLDAADTNDAHAYYVYGLRMMDDDKPSESVRAFYWAAKIDPTSGDYLYDLWIARLMEMPFDQFMSYGNLFAKEPRPAAFLALDTLQYRAYLLKPFLFRRLDERLVERVIKAQLEQAHSPLSRTMMEIAMTQGRRASASRAYSHGGFSTAAAIYAAQLKDEKVSKKMHELFDSGIHAERSRLFFLLDNMDSARAEMVAAIDGRRARDSAHVVYLYQSTTMYELSLGIIYEVEKNASEARAAYEQAVTEDLSNYAAHARLSQLQLAAGDTTSALTEMNLAVELEPDDPALHFEYALTLVRALHDAEASDHLRKAIAADSVYAAPHLLLAIIAGVEGYDDQAIDEYRRFVTLAAKTDPQYAFAKGQIDKLGSALATTMSKP